MTIWWHEHPALLSSLSAGDATAATAREQWAHQQHGGIMKWVWSNYQPLQRMKLPLITQLHGMTYHWSVQPVIFSYSFSSILGWNVYSLRNVCVLIWSERVACRYTLDLRTILSIFRWSWNTWKNHAISRELDPSNSSSDESSTRLRISQPKIAGFFNRVEIVKPGSSIG
jgi:hypothetical protein